MTNWRYIAQRALTNEWLHWDLPLTRDELSWSLSGAGSLTGTFAPEYGRLRGPDGRPLLEEWGTLLYAEADGVLRWGGILVSSDYSGGAWSIEAAGFCTYPNGIPCTSNISGVSVDPTSVFRQIWADVQAQPDGNLGVQVDPHVFSPHTIGTSDSPYQFAWWNAGDCGQELDSLAQQGMFDYVEEHRWHGDSGSTVDHYVHLGYPRLGRKRTDLAFVAGENVTSVVTPQDHGDTYANEVLGLGAGEGSAALKRQIAQRDGRLRRPIVYSDVSITSADRMDSLIRQQLTAHQQTLTIPSITVADHPHARIGSWQLGDDILVQATVPWLGDVSIWHRITGWSLLTDSTATLTLARSDSFVYGG